MESRVGAEKRNIDLFASDGSLESRRTDRPHPEDVPAGASNQVALRRVAGSEAAGVEAAEEAVRTPDGVEADHHPTIVVADLTSRGETNGGDLRVRPLRASLGPPVSPFSLANGGRCKIFEGIGAGDELP